MEAKWGREPPKIRIQFKLKKLLCLYNPLNKTSNSKWFNHHILSCRTLQCWMLNPSYTCSVTIITILNLNRGTILNLDSLLLKENHSHRLHLNVLGMLLQQGKIWPRNLQAAITAVLLKIIIASSKMNFNRESRLSWLILYTMFKAIQW
jgi:hypothetical protein